jgi:ATP-dependent protease HslVU (ClpYQ) peptidase subunit
MTTIAAAKKGKKLCIGCDSLTLFGNRKEKLDQLSQKKDKIIKYKSTYLGCSGAAVWTEVLDHYFKNSTLEYGFDTVETIYMEMSRLHKALKKDYFLTPRQGDDDIFSSSEHLLLFINHHGIFEVDWMRNVRQYAHFAAIGTGDEYALGAMKAVYENENDPQTIVRKGLEAAAKFDQKTEMPAFYHVLKVK